MSRWGNKEYCLEICYLGFVISYNQQYSFRIIVFDHSIYLDLNMFDFISVAINWASYVIWSNKFLYPTLSNTKALT